MKRFLIGIFCLFFICAALPAAADEMVSLKLGYQSLTPSGTLAGNSNGVGTEIDVERDTNLSDSEDLTAEVALQFGIARLSLGYLPMEYSGTGQITINGQFNGQSFSVGDVVSTKVKLNLYDLGLTLNLINLDDMPVRLQLGPELAVKMVEAEVDFVDTVAGIKEHESASVPIPTIGARARVGLSDFVSIVA
ncbi:hypothetical protein, partial [Sedimenticola sp.]|uniref:hypothetical protein n=1 Tax=Sedimenticola sp. TaxID=1940285 RepID=UPI003D146566